MSDYLPSAGANTSVAPLAGYSDYDRWAQDFQIACQYKGIWNLFTGKEAIIPKPNAYTYEYHIRHASSDAVVKYWQHREDVEHEKWEKQDRKIQHAMAFLAESVDPSFRAGVQKYFNPSDAFAKLKTSYDLLRL